MNILFIPLNQKETRWSLALAALYFIAGLALESVGRTILVIPVFVAAVIIARRFFRETFRCLPLTGKQLIWKPLVGALGCRALCFLVHDLFMLLGFRYFTGSDWGPVLWNIRSALLEQAQLPLWFAAVTVVVLMPIVEEYLFRGAILGTIYPKNSVLGVILSVVLFTAFHTLPYIAPAVNAMGSDAGLYIALYAFQYIPMGLFLSWLYISTDCIFAPMIMHIILNYGLVF